MSARFLFAASLLGLVVAAPGEVVAGDWPEFRPARNAVLLEP